ncbi:MAG: hypothetical protein WC389_15505 [Lutibacter sp.]|jgi:hypothetical protein
MKQKIKDFLCTAIDIIFTYLKWQWNFWNIMLIGFLVMGVICTPVVYDKNISFTTIIAFTFCQMYTVAYFIIRIMVTTERNTKYSCSRWVKRKYKIDEDFNDIY